MSGSPSEGKYAYVSTKKEVNVRHLSCRTSFHHSRRKSQCAGILIQFLECPMPMNLRLHFTYGGIFSLQPIDVAGPFFADAYDCNPNIVAA